MMTRVFSRIGTTERSRKVSSAARSTKMVVRPLSTCSAAMNSPRPLSMLARNADQLDALAGELATAAAEVDAEADAASGRSRQRLEGLAANLTVNPLEAVTTVTVQIVTLLVGDQEFESAKTLAAFALGLALFFFTLLLNVAAL